MENNNNRVEIIVDYPDGNWCKYQYDSNENLIYYENSDGYFFRYDSNGKIIDKGHKDTFPTPSQIKQFIENGK